MKELTPEEIRDYACEDADVTLKLKKKLVFHSFLLYFTSG